MRFAASARMKSPMANPNSSTVYQIASLSIGSRGRFSPLLSIRLLPALRRLPLLIATTPVTSYGAVWPHVRDAASRSLDYTSLSELLRDALQSFPCAGRIRERSVRKVTKRAAYVARLPLFWGMDCRKSAFAVDRWKEFPIWRNMRNDRYANHMRHIVILLAKQGRWSIVRLLCC